jgi:hypothetical protein
MIRGKIGNVSCEFEPDWKMKLLQYRFSADDVNESAYVGREVELFFRRANDLNLIGIFSIATEPGGVERKRLQPSDLPLIIEQSFQQSYSIEKIDYSKRASIKSSESCRFVVFEDDGLLRICYSSDNDTIKFVKLSPQISDVSNLLIETDLFDFL